MRNCFFYGCSKHWPLSLSLDSYFRLNNADYHFKKLKKNDSADFFKHIQGDFSF